MHLIKKFKSVSTFPLANLSLSQPPLRFFAERNIVKATEKVPLQDLEKNQPRGVDVLRAQTSVGSNDEHLSGIPTQGEDVFRGHVVPNVGPGSNAVRFVSYPQNAGGTPGNVAARSKKDNEINSRISIDRKRSSHYNEDYSKFDLDRNNDKWHQGNITEYNVLRLTEYKPRK